MKYYIIGSLSNPRVLEVTKALRAAKMDCFSEWFCSGPDADQHWWAYGKALGLSWAETTKLDFVQTAFSFDFRHMQAADGCILVMNAGKSAHCELGWFIGRGKKAYILYDGEPDRADLMPANLATASFYTIEELLHALKSPANQFPEIRDKNPGVHLNIPRLGLSCACPDCVRDRRDLGGSGVLNDHQVAQFVENMELQ